MLQEEVNKIIPKIPAIIKAVLSEKNREKMEALFEKGSEMKEDFEEFIQGIFEDAEICAQLVLDILEAPLSEAGIDFEVKSRDLNKAEVEVFLKAEMMKVLEA